MADKTEPQRMEFQTEAKQLLHLMIHSLYSHKEVFLRELISNASDALDKLRFESVTNPALLGDDTELKITVDVDKKKKIITITDNGIGMTRQEVIDNVGTIARSGSKAFLEKLSGNQKSDSNLIGQFGVGFYSVFMVASMVKLVTKRAGSDESAVVWESSGENEFTLSDTVKKTRGTEITIYLKEEESTYAELYQVRSIIKKYSDFIAFPIYLPDDKGKEEVVNESKPIWKRPASELNDEQYELFYKQSLHGFEKPLCTIHSQAEGVLEYAYVLFIPEKAPFDLFNMERKHGVKLYVKRVFIMEDCKDLLPEYLRFIKGVVDSEDLPLNVSREMLQHNPIMEKMKKNLVVKVLGKLKEMAENSPDQFKTFWKQFGSVLKEGIHTDFENKDKLLEILRLQSSMGAKEEYTTLKEYVSRMREDQKDIYYILAENRELAEKSPHLEVLRSKSVEVLYMVDPIDEWIVTDINTYEGKQLKSITAGNLDLGELDKDTKKENEKAESTYKKLTERIKNILAEEVKDVRVSMRLAGSPACLVSDESGMGIQMEKMMKAMGQDVPESKKTLEINPHHQAIININAMYEKNATDPALDEYVKLICDQALIAEGHVPKDPVAYSKRVNDLLVKATSAV